MNNQFKKLFDIPYNDKIFTIFVDGNHRYTFLEKNKEGNYLYPTLEDYKSLNKIYNEHNPFILPNVKQYTFKEKVRVGALALAVTVVLSACGNKNEEPITTETWTIEEESEEVIVTQENSLPASGEISFTDLLEISKMNPISIKSIDLAIEKNIQLDENFKKLAHNLAVAIYDKEPNADLRIYFLNLQTLKAEAMSDEEYKQKFQDYSQACYVIQENKIYYKIGSNEETLYHELAHSTYCFDCTINGQYYYRSDNFYRALNEAMNNKIVNFIMPTHTYKNNGFVLDYLLNFVDYDYNRYNEEGVSYIIKELHEKYPSIDVFYINDCLNAMMDSYSKLGKYIQLSDCEDLVDLLITLSNEKLSESDIENKIKPYEEVKGLLFDGTNIYPYTELDGCYATIIEDGVKKEQTFYSSMSQEIDSNYLELFLRKELMENPNIEFSSDFWKHYAALENFVSAASLYETNILVNGNFLTKTKLCNIKIQVGLTSTNEIGFIVSDDKGIIYESEKNLKNCSNPIQLTDYYDNVETLELTDILNEKYLKAFVEKNPLFHNLFLEQDQLQLEKLTSLYITSENQEKRRWYLNRCYLAQSEEEFSHLGNGVIGINIEIPSEERIYLKDVLKYYNLFEEDKTDYYFTTQEIKELVSNYIEEMNYGHIR